MMVNISFPGLGIEQFTVNPVAFTVFGLEVRWYAIMIMTGMICAILYAMWRSRREGFVPDDVIDMAIYMIFFGVIGARLFYVLMELDNYILPNRSVWENLKDLINIRGGGLAIYGGIITGALTLIIFCRIKKKNFVRGLDMVAPGVMIAQALGRWGNFFNGEAHGGIVGEGSPLYFLRMGLDPNDLTFGMAYVHPTFLYESLWNVVGFILINLFVYPKKKFDGQVLLTYLAWYGFGRMFIEGLRTDSLYLFGFRVSQIIGFLCFVIGTALIVLMLIRTHRKEAEGEYQPVFADVSGEGEKAEENVDTEDTEDGNDH